MLLRSVAFSCGSAGVKPTETFSMDLATDPFFSVADLATDPVSFVVDLATDPFLVADLATDLGIVCFAKNGNRPLQGSFQLWFRWHEASGNPRVAVGSWQLAVNLKKHIVTRFY